MTPRPKKKILFLCTGNAARSQMAEALARADHGDLFDPVSAGSRPAGFVHPLAIDALREIGISADEARSKSAEEFRDAEFHLVVTVCDSAARDCPTWPNTKEIENWPVEDPSWGPDDPATRFDRFRQTRDELRGRIDALADRITREQEASGRSRTGGQRGSDSS